MAFATLSHKRFKGHGNVAIYNSSVVCTMRAKLYQVERVFSFQSSDCTGATMCHRRINVRFGSGFAFVRKSFDLF